MSKLQNFLKGLIKENPVLVLVLGTCPTLAISTSVIAAFGMGIAATAVLILSNMAISAIRKIVPDPVRIPCYIVVIAGFVTVVELVMEAYAFSLYQSLGVYLSLIVVNCIIIGRAEAFCQKNPVGPSFFDGIFQGLGYTLVLIAMCVIRELLGKGTFGTGIFNTIDGVIGTGNGIKIFEPEYGALVLTLPIGGFITLGCLIALMQYALRKSAEKKEAKEKALAAQEKEAA